MNHKLLAVLPLLAVLILLPAVSYAQLNNTGLNGTDPVPDPIPDPIPEPSIEPVTQGFPTEEFKAKPAESFNLRTPYEYALKETIRGEQSYTEVYTDGDENTFDVYKTSTAQKRIAGWDGEYSAPYYLHETETTVKVETPEGSFVFNKDACAITFYNGELINQDSVPIIDSDSFYFRGAVNGTDTWFGINAINNGSCQTEIFEDGTNIEVRGTKVATGQAEVKIRYIKLSGELLKPQLEITNMNPSWDNHKFSILETMHVPDDVTFGNTTYNIEQYNGTFVDRTWIQDNNAELVKITDTVHYDIGLGWDQLWGINIVYEDNTSKVVFDYSNQNDVILPGETLVLDPKYGTSPDASFHVALTDDNDNDVCETSPPSLATSTTNIQIRIADAGTSFVDCKRLVFEWTDFTSIPQYSDLIDVDFITDISSSTANARECDIYSMENPSTVTNSDLWSDAADGTLYVNDSVLCLDGAEGNNIKFDLGETAVTDLETIIQSGGGFFGIGMKYDDESLGTDDGTTFDEEGTPTPSLIITYTVPLPTVPEVAITVDTPTSKTVETSTNSTTSVGDILGYYWARSNVNSTIIERCHEPFTSGCGLVSRLTFDGHGTGLRDIIIGNITGVLPTGNGSITTDGLLVDYEFDATDFDDIFYDDFDDNFHDTTNLWNITSSTLSASEVNGRWEVIVPHNSNPADSHTMISYKTINATETGFVTFSQDNDSGGSGNTAHSQNGLIFDDQNKVLIDSHSSGGGSSYEVNIYHNGTVVYDSNQSGCANTYPTKFTYETAIDEFKYYCWAGGVGPWTLYTTQYYDLDGSSTAGSTSDGIAHAQVRVYDFETYIGFTTFIIDDIYLVDFDYDTLRPSLLKNQATLENIGATTILDESFNTYSNGTRTADAVFGNSTTQIIEDFTDYADQSNLDASWIQIPHGVTQIFANYTSERIEWEVDDDGILNDDMVYYDLGSTVSENGWVLRGKLNTSTLTEGVTTSTEIIIGLNDEATPTWAGGVDFIGFGGHITPTPVTTYRIMSVNELNPILDTQGDGTFSKPWLIETIWFEISRTSETKFTVKLFSDNTYSLDSLIEERVGITQSAVDNLRYITVQGFENSGGLIAGYVDDLEFYDSTHTIAIPNLQTADAVWGTAGTSIIEDGTTYTDQTDFDNSWVSLDTAFSRGNPTNNNIDFNFATSGNDESITYDLGSAVGNEWSLKGKFRFDTLVSGLNAMVQFSLSDIASGGMTTAQDTVSVKIDTGLIDRLSVMSTDGASDNGDTNTSNSNFVWLIDTDYYFELTRLSATQVKAVVYSDPEHTTVLVDSGIGAITGTVDGLQYFRVSHIITGGTEQDQGTLDDLEIFNGALNSREWANNWVTKFEPNNYVNLDQEKINWIIERQGDQNEFMYDLGNADVCDDSCVVRFHWVNTLYDTGNTNGKFGFFGLFADPDSYFSTNQDTLGMYVAFSSHASNEQDYRLSSSDGVAIGSSAFTYFIEETSLGDDFYVELIRTSPTKAILNFFTDANYTNLHESVSLPIPATSTDYRYFGMKTNWGAGAVTGEMLGTIDNVQLYSGYAPLGSSAKGIINSAITPMNGNGGQPGIRDQAYDFDGTDDFVETSMSGFFDTQDTFSISTWVNPDVSGSPYIVTEHKAGVDEGMVFYLTALKPAFYLEDAGAQWNQCISTSAVPVGEWSHVVVTVVGQASRVSDCTGVSIYVDGVATPVTISGSGTVGALDQNENVFIGGKHGTSNFLDGQLDDVLIFNRAITNSEVLNYYNTGRSIDAITGAGGLPGGQVSDDNLIAHYDFEDIGYKTHTFTGNSTFTINSGSGNVEYLVVSGGGGGAGNGKGAGAGGNIQYDTVLRNAGAYTVTVGSGGSANIVLGGPGFDGGDSVFGNITASGIGTHGETPVPYHGGNTTINVSGNITNYLGGSFYDNGVSGNGGAGAGGDGGDGFDTNHPAGNFGGEGGAGYTSSISGSPVCYAGGGGGGVHWDVGTVGIATCGGSNGGIGIGGVAAAATANTGGGGGSGGGKAGVAHASGGAGGSGIVIIKYIDDGSIDAIGGVITSESKLENQITLDATPDFTDDYTTATGWTVGGSSNIVIDDGDSNRVDFNSPVSGASNTNEFAYKSLNQTLGDTWTVDFEFQANTWGANGVHEMPLCLTAGTGWPVTASQDAICFSVDNWRGYARVYANDNGAWAVGTGGDISTFDILKTYYISMKKIDNTHVTLIFFTDPERTTAVLSKTYTVPSGLNGFTHIQHIGTSYTPAPGYTYDAQVDNTFIYNGVAILGAAADGTNFGVTINVPGKYNQAYNYDGIDDYSNTNVDVTNDNSDYSISFWYNSDTTNGDVLMSSIDSDFDQENFEIRVGTTMTVYKRTDSTTNDADHLTSTTTFEAGQWYHITFVYDDGIANDQANLPDGAMKLYVNGVLEDDSITDTAFTNTGSLTGLRIGNSIGDTAWYDGKIDDLKIYHRTLTAPEIGILAESFPVRTGTFAEIAPIFYEFDNILSIADAVWGTNANLIIDDFTTYTDQTDADASWIPTDNTKLYADTTNDRLHITMQRDATANGIYYDVTGATVSDSAWTLQFKYTPQDLDGAHLMWLGMSSITGVNTASQDFLGSYHITNQPTEWYSKAIDGGALTTNGATSDLYQMIALTDYYFTYSRLSATEFQTIVRSDSHDGDILFTMVETIASTITDLRYFNISESNLNDVGGSDTVHIDDLEFYDGVSLVLENQATIENYNPTVDFADAYTTNAGWTQVSTGVDVDSTTADKVNFDGIANADRRVYKQLPEVLGIADGNETSWTYDFITNFTDVSCSCQFYLVSLAAGAGIPLSASQDMIAVMHDSAQLFISSKDGAGGVVNAATGLDLELGVEQYLRLSRTSPSSVSLEIFSDSARTNLIGSSVEFIDAGATITGLTHLHHAIVNVGGSGTMVGTVDASVIYKDFSTLGKSVDGVNYGATVVEGIRGNAYDFDGIDDFIDVGTSFNPYKTDPFTISVWIKFDSAVGGTEAIIMGNMDATNNCALSGCTNGGWALYQNGQGGVGNGTTDEIKFLIADDVDTPNQTFKGRMHTGDFVPDNNVWYHFVIVKRDFSEPDEGQGYLQMYVNGVLRGNSGGGNTVTEMHKTAGNLNWEIGNSADRGTYGFFDGQIDDLAIFNSVLTGGQVLQLYNGGDGLDIIDGFLGTNGTVVYPYITLGFGTEDYNNAPLGTEIFDVTPTAPNGDAIWGDGYDQTIEDFTTYTTWTDTDGGWDRVSIDWDVDETNDNAVMTFISTSTDKSVAKEITGIDLDGDWTLRFSSNRDAGNARGDGCGTTKHWIELTDTPVGAGTSTVRDSVGITLWDSTGPIARVLYNDNSATSTENIWISASGSDFFDDTVKDYWQIGHVNLNTTHNTLVTRLYSDSTYTTILDSSRVLVPSTVGDFTHLAQRNHGNEGVCGAGNDGEIYYYDDFELISGWDGRVSKIGGSMFLDGKTFYSTATEIESNFDFDTTDSFSLSYWIDHTPDTTCVDFAAFGTTYDDCTVVPINKEHFEGGTDNKGYESTIDKNEYARFILMGTGAEAINVTALDTKINNGWKHIVNTYDGSSSASGAHIYINGVEQTLTVYTDTLASSISNEVNMRIGKGTVDASFLQFLSECPYECVIGGLDDVRVYNIELTPQQVTNLYNYNELSEHIIIDDTVLANNTYSYNAFGVNQNGFSDGSTFVALVNITVPTVPLNLDVTSTSTTQLDLDWDVPIWDGNSPITGYKIERESPVGDGFTTLIPDTGTNATAYSNTILLSATQYNYRVSAINSIGIGDPGNEAYNWTQPDAPISPSAAPKSDVADQINLEWTAPSGTITGYLIEYETPIGNGFVVLEANYTGGLYYNHTGLTENTTYNYRIASVTNPVGPYSPPFNATTGDAPDAPLNVSATIVDPDLDPLNVLINWDAPLDIGSNTVITGYDIIRSVNLGPYTSLVNDTAGLTYNDLTVVPSTNYTYAISAKGDVINGNFSAPSNTVVTSSLPSAPTSLNVTPKPGNTALELTWSLPVDDGGSAINGYQIQRNIDDAGYVTIVANSNSTVRAYTDSGLSEQVNYKYVVYAINGIGGSTGSPITHGEFSYAEFTIINTPLITSNIRFDVGVEMTYGVPTTDITDVWLRYWSSDNIADAVMSGLPVSVAKGGIANFTLYDNPPPVDGGTEYYIEIRTENGEVLQFKDLSTEKLIGAPLTTFQGNVVGEEFRNENFTQSTVLLAGQPSFFDLVVIYAEKGDIDSTTTFVFEDVESFVNYTSPVADDLDYYVSVYFDPTFDFDVGQPGNATVPIGYLPDITLISMGDPNLKGFDIGIDVLAGESGIFGLPLVFIFIIALASVFTGRSAPMGIIFIAVAIGVMTYMGLISFDFDPANESNIATWAIIIVAVIIGVMVGKRYD